MYIVPVIFPIISALLYLIPYFIDHINWPRILKIHKHDLGEPTRTYTTQSTISKRKVTGAF